MSETLIESLDDPRLDPYRQLRSNSLGPRAGRFIAEGRFVVERLLASDFAVESVVLTEHRRSAIDPSLLADTPVYVVPKALGHILVGFNFHTGILACGRRKSDPSLASVLNGIGEVATVVACPRMFRPENLGTILRLSAAFGVDAVLLGPGSADPYSRRVLRISMGNVFRLNVIRCDELEKELAQLRRRGGFELAAAVADDDAMLLGESPRPKRLALLFGNEAHGLEPSWLEQCAHRVTIPMAPGVDSLNVANAAAIVMYHFMCVARQPA